MSDCSRVKLNSIRTHIISFVPLNQCKYLIYNDKKKCRKMIKSCVSNTRLK